MQDNVRTAALQFPEASVFHPKVNHLDCHDKIHILMTIKITIMFLRTFMNEIAHICCPVEMGRIKKMCVWGCLIMSTMDCDTSVNMLRVTTGQHAD